MLAPRLSFCISLLLLPSIICAAKVDIKDVIQLAREEVLLEAPCRDMYYLRDLVQKRMERFYTAVYTFIIAGPPGTVSRCGRSYLEDIDETISYVDLPPGAPASPTTRRFPVVLVENEPVQSCYIISVVDLATPKASSPAVLQAWRVAISKLKKTMDASILPLLQPPASLFIPLNRFSGHQHAQRIYNRLFKVYSAYRDIVVDIAATLVRRDIFKSAAIAMSDPLDAHCWSALLPNGPQPVKTVLLRASSIKTLNCRAGQFVQKGALFASTVDDKPLLAPCDLVLLSYELDGDNILCTHITIDSSLEPDPCQYPHAIHLIRAFEEGRLCLQNYKKHATLWRDLDNSTIHFIENVIDNLETVRPTCLDSYHPQQLDPILTPQILARTDHYGRKMAKAASSRFESAAVQERVFKSELTAWWNAFIPGSRVLFLLPFDADPLVLRPFKPFNSPTSSRIQKEYPALRDVKEPWFASMAFVNRSLQWADSAIIECPRTPIQHHKGRIQTLLKLVR